ncbi:MAG: transcriptional repressor [Abitibacteriaceae bacterium]|nr:transcriptional repressor [Abditibacteriaceae bacterium]
MAHTSTPTGTDKQERLEALRRRLADGGHRITPQRLCVLAALLDSNQHPTAEAIYARVRKVSPTTSLATVYKTIDTLKALGEVQELEFGDGRYHYDGVDPVPHPHAICTRCGKIEDVHLPQTVDLSLQARQLSGYAIASQRIEFYGLCKLCQQHGTQQHGSRPGRIKP